MTQEPEEANEIAGEIEDVAALKQALAEERVRAEANLAGWQRAQADFVNYKRRAEQEREETASFANSALILKLLPVLDDWELALANVPADLADLGWVEGIRLIERKFRAVLEAQGLSPIEVVGQPFDPNLHEAAMTGRGREGIVIAELQRGYRLYERVLRPARVVVGNREEEKEA